MAEPIQFQSEPLPLRTALIAWAQGAYCIAHPFVPRHVREIAYRYFRRNTDECGTLEDIRTILEEAQRRAEWDSDHVPRGMLEAFVVAPKMPEVDTPEGDALCWETSTDVLLWKNPDGPGWFVGLTEPHPDREEAIRNAIEREE